MGGAVKKLPICLSFVFFWLSAKTLPQLPFMAWNNSSESLLRTSHSLRRAHRDHPVPSYHDETVTHSASLSLCSTRLNPCWHIGTAWAYEHAWPSCWNCLSLVNSDSNMQLILFLDLPSALSVEGDCCSPAAVVFCGCMEQDVSSGFNFQNNLAFLSRTNFSPEKKDVKRRSRFFGLFYITIVISSSVWFNLIFLMTGENWTSLLGRLVVQTLSCTNCINSLLKKNKPANSLSSLITEQAQHIQQLN